MTLKHRVADTEDAQRVELSREYRALKSRTKGQSVEKWLSSWETTYAKAKKFNIPEIWHDQAIRDFITAMRSIDPGFADTFSIMMNFRDDDSRLTFGQVLGCFRGHFRRAASRATTSTAFTRGEEELV